MEFANPVIGTSEPAPANFPILLKMLSPVKKAAIPINIIETIVDELVASSPLYLQKSNIICPIEQISPPTQKALKQFLNRGIRRFLIYIV